MFRHKPDLQWYSFVVGYRSSSKLLNRIGKQCNWQQEIVVNLISEYKQWIGIVIRVVMLESDEDVLVPEYLETITIP